MIRTATSIMIGGCQHNPRNVLRPCRDLLRAADVVPGQYGPEWHGVELRQVPVLRVFRCVALWRVSALRLVVGWRAPGDFSVHARGGQRLLIRVPLRQRRA